MKKHFLNPLRALTLFTAVIALVFTMSCGEDEDPGPEENIYEIVSGNEDLSTLKGLLDEEGLDGTLSAEGEMTLFAPSNAAMVRLLTTLGLTSFDPVSADIQTAVLSYHLHTMAKIAAGDLTGTLTTAQGELITIEPDNSEGILNTGASVNGNITTSIEATNGYVHIVDVVLVPPTIGGVIVATLGTAAQPILLSSAYSNLATAIQKADAGKPAEETLVGALISLSASGVTVFAPVNEALTTDLVGSLSAAQLDAIIRGHVIPSNVSPLADGTYGTAGGTEVVVAGETVAGPNETPYPIVTASATASTNWTVYPIAGVIQ